MGHCIGGGPGRGSPLSDGEHKVFRGWVTQGILVLMDMFLSDDKILKRGTQLWFNSWGHVPN